MGSERYPVIRRIAIGGMAEIFLARQVAPGDIERLVVVKRVLPHLAQDPRFVAMFLDEARTAVDLSHPNVVRVLDVGQDQEGYFLVMEHLVGHDLARLGAHVSDRGEAVPLAVALQIGLDAARGLDHAHRMRDRSGRPLELVHRDVSPSNLFVTADGFTKVLDFGIARARSRSRSTEPGVLKGKYAYMAPEVVAGSDATALSDQFSLGVVLYELTTGRDAFRRDTDAATLRAVAACEFDPPGTIDPSCPPGLEKIVMRALAPSPDRRFSGLDAFAAAVEALQRELDLESGPEPVARWLSSIGCDLPAAVVAATAVTDFADPARRRGAKSDDPGFVGRVRDLEVIQGHLSDRRLVTLVGTGGIGKTRLARRVLETEQVRGHQVVFCDLTEARTLHGLGHAVALAIGSELAAADDAERALAHLGQAMRARGPLLLVLDNVEQITAFAARAVTLWLAAARETRFLVTSRERLGVPDEVVHEVEPLDLPATGEQIESSGAGRLFLERARQARPDFLLGPDERPDVWEILGRLEGMPLAIELAAARLAILPPRELLERLSRRFELLSGGNAGVPRRQAALKNAIDWSWQLLGEPERSALAQASIFRGGFDARAAEAVIELDPGAPPVLDVIQHLRHKSLLRVTVDRGDVRLGMYESIREYAWDRLCERGGIDELMARHADHFVGVGEALVRGLRRRDGIERLRRLEVECENLAAAHRRSLEAAPFTASHAARALGAALALAPLLDIRGPVEEHIAFLDQALERDDGADPRLRWRALVARARACRSTGRRPAAIDELLAIRDQVRAAGDHDIEGLLLSTVGLLCDIDGRVPEARAYLEEARALHARHRQDELEPETLRILGGTYMGEDQERAIRYLESAIAAARRTGDVRSEGRSLNYLGMTWLMGLELERAEQLFREVLSKNAIVGDVPVEASSHMHLGVVYLERGDPDRAEPYFRAAVELLSRVGEPRNIANAHRHVAQLRWQQGRLDEALAALDEGLSQTEGDPPTRAWNRMYAAGLLARAGDPERAAQVLDESRAVLAESGDTQGVTVARVLDGFMLLARSAAAASATERDRLRAEAEEIARRDFGVPSDEVRFSQRVLRLALAGDGQPAEN